MELTQEQLKKLIRLDRSTGVCYWRVDRGGKARKGTAVGTLHSQGYVVTRINGKTYPVHRLIWFMLHGCWPTSVDHKNGVRHDNRPRNLREATLQLNAQNKRGAQGANPYLGVCLKKKRSPTERTRWSAKLTIGKKQVHLGYFSTPEKARRAYLAAKKVLHVAHGAGRLYV